MGRMRTLKPEFFTDEELAELSPLHRLLFAGLWTVADRDGRLEDRPKMLKAVLLPWDACDIDRLLEDLHEAEFIQRYEVDGKRCIHIPEFPKHQKPHPKERSFGLPEPVSRETPRPSREISRQEIKDPDPIPSSPAGCGGGSGLGSGLGNGPTQPGMGAPATAGVEPPSDSALRLRPEAQRELADRRQGEGRSQPTPPEPTGPTLSERLKAVWREFHASDVPLGLVEERLLQPLMAKHSDEEIAAVFRVALERGDKYPTCTGIPALVKHFAFYAGKGLLSVASTPAPSKPQPTTRAGKRWGQVLDAIAGEGMAYAREQLEKLEPVAVAPDGALVLRSDDRFFGTWLEDQYGAELRRLIPEGIRIDSTPPQEATA